MKNCAIVIPIYRKPNAYEKYSYDTLKSVIKDKDIYVVCGNNFKNELEEKVERFDDSYFDSLKDYSRLCKSYEFYNRFSEYKYILIYQLDCLIFKDNIDYWCEKNYDYIGSPIISNDLAWDFFPIVGNGGFSLRKVEYFKSITDPNGDFRKKYDPILANHRKIDLYDWYEDLYFCEFVSSNWLFDVPTIEESLKFSIDMNPDRIFGEEVVLPMGCHGYCKNIPFWEKIIDFPENVKEDSYKEYDYFISYYYGEQS